MGVFGRVDIVVNNAGTSRTAPFESLTDQLLQLDLDQKLFSATRLTGLAWAQMKMRAWGRVINVLSVSAKTPSARSAPTSVTRAAGMALTKVLAGEGAPHNILVNALLVGIIASDQHVQRARELSVPTDAYLKSVARHAPIGRAGEPDELAGLAAFLASDAGSYVTGTAINVDGGPSATV